MSDALKVWAFVFLALRGLIDLTIAVIIYYQMGSAAVFGLLLICGVFYFFLYSGIKNEGFRGRYGSRVILWREPGAYWFIVALLIVLHLVITALMVRLIHL